MANFGTYNNNRQTTNNYPEVTVYSNYRMGNPESKIDATCITFRYWKTNLCIGIFQRKDTGNDEVSYDMDNGITIYLSHSKARILKAELENFIKDPCTYNAVGVPSGQAAITISNGAEYGKNTPVITIRKINEEGKVVSSFAYECKTDYYYSIRNYDGESFDTITEDYKNLEIEQIITLLDEYIKAATNAIAFTVMDQRKYSATRTDNKLDAIAAALNVDIKSSNGSGQRAPKSSYFNNMAKSSESSGYGAGSVAYGSATIDDLE